MSHSRFDKPQLDLSRRPERGPWLVDMQGFFELSFWMAEELLDLEARFKPAAKRVNLRHQDVNWPV